MPTYKTKLKRGKDGQFTKYVGKTHNGVKTKFRLGFDPKEADRRLKLIQTLWNDLESRFPPRMTAYWDKKSLDAARLIAKGKGSCVPKRDHEMHEVYVERLARMSKDAEQPVLPTHLPTYQAGLQLLRQEIEDSKERLASALDSENVIGMTLGQAFDRYETHLRDEYGVPDGRLKPWGKTKIDNVSSIRSYLSHEKTAKCNYLELDLGQLTLTVCDDIYRVIRSRPYSIRTGFAERLTLSSAGNLKKELTCFFDWIDGTDEIDWYLPRRFNSVKKKRIDKLTPQEEYERDLARENRVIPKEQLVTLYEYAIPEERILMLLGLNCAFGAAEIGQLREGFLKFATNQIDGIRFKSGGKTKHQLWAATRDGLQWWLKQREKITPLNPADADVVFLTATGRPLWKNTSEGNASNGIANRWHRLLDRVQRDIPDFPRPSFNKLRKTAATRILSIASAEVASMILAHKTISDDELLHHYVNLDWTKLFDAQTIFEDQMQEMFEAGGDAPWEPRPKSYIGLAKGRQILDLHKQGIAANEIAERLDVNKATVYRHISAEIGPRRSGRSRKRQLDTN